MTGETIFPIRDYTMSVNDFNEPKEHNKAEALMLLITRIILLEPGTIQSHPDMGVGLITNFRHRLDDGTLVSDLQSRIKLQIDTYLPFLSGVNVNVKIKNKAFLISISIDSAIFGILYDTESNSIQTDYKTIAEL